MGTVFCIYITASSRVHHIKQPGAQLFIKNISNNQLKKQKLSKEAYKDRTQLKNQTRAHINFVFDYLKSVSCQLSVQSYFSQGTSFLLHCHFYTSQVINCALLCKCIGLNRLICTIVQSIWPQLYVFLTNCCVLFFCLSNCAFREYVEQFLKSSHRQKLLTSASWNFLCII